MNRAKLNSWYINSAPELQKNRHPYRKQAEELLPD